MCQVHTKNTYEPAYVQEIYLSQAQEFVDNKAHDKGCPKLVLKRYQLFFFIIFIHLRMVCKCNQWRIWNHNTFTSFSLNGCNKLQFSATNPVDTSIFTFLLLFVVLFLYQFEILLRIHWTTMSTTVACVCRTKNLICCPTDCEHTSILRALVEYPQGNLEEIQ